LKEVVYAGTCLPFIPRALQQSAVPVPVQAPPAKPVAPSAPEIHTPILRTSLSHEDDLFLEEVEKGCFQFFWEQTDPGTGLAKDRSKAQGPDTRELASIAATGFGLTGLCIGDMRGYIDPPRALERARVTLRFFWKQMAQQRGFFYHWANVKTGARLRDSEVSSIDTAILLCGILTCRQYFQDDEVKQLAQQIFNRVDWNWVAEDTRMLSLGWTPESGFLPYRWDSYNELMMMYLLGIGSATHPLPPETWDAWKRPIFEYDHIRYIGSSAPLFVHQYSQAWFDFRDKRDKYADYFQNSRIATEVHRRFCLSLASQFPDYSDDLWGITASDSQQGYVVWGGPPATGPIDGTVVPCATGGSIPFLPQPTLRVLKNIKANYGRAWSPYGFVDAFNPLKNWYDADVVGIDTGITMIMAENARTSFVWDTFMKNPEAQRGMQLAGFHSYQPTVDEQPIFLPFSNSPSQEVGPPAMRAPVPAAH
jgi:hypothetical protein